MGNWLPIIEWLPRYQLSWLRHDLVAGATVWAVLVPLGLAYSGIVGVDPVVGLYTIPLALVGYAVFGGSRLLVAGPEAAVAVFRRRWSGRSWLGKSTSRSPLPWRCWWA